MLISLAVDHHGADVATRERFHVAPDRLARLADRGDDDGIHELALLSTCNRTELYAWCADATESSLPAVQRVLARRWTGSRRESAALLAVATRRADLNVARHAMRVAVGLESQVLGDRQILGQFRAAYREATAVGAIGSVLHRLFETALHAGKRVQAETMLGSGPNSVGAQAATLAARRYGNLTHTRIVVVGCGKTGERVARQLLKLGARDLVLLNRTRERADRLAQELGVRAAALDTVHAEIAMADIAIVATGALTPLVRAAALAQARANCATTGDPLLLVDLSMPRNVEASAGALPGLTIVDLDALQPHVTATELARRRAVPCAERIVDEELRQFTEWLAIAEAREAIRPLHAALRDVCRREVAYALGDEAADHVADRIVSKVLALPMSAVRGAVARGEHVAGLTRAIGELFATERPPVAGRAARALRIDP
jgi:glutamyl-tRNA reductase